LARKNKTEYDAATSASNKQIDSQELKQMKEQFSDERKYNFTTAINSLHQFREKSKDYRKSIATFDKEQLINGVVKFITADLIPQVGDRNTKFVLSMAKDSLKENSELADEFLDSPMVSSLIKKTGNDYDITNFSTILKGVLTEYQSLPVTIPKIPLFSPVEKVIKITAEDVDKLMSYISAV
jgi:hypothetical protein